MDIDKLYPYRYNQCLGGGSVLLDSRQADCYKAITALGMDEKVIEKLIHRFCRALSKWLELIDNSFLPDGQKRQYKKSSCAAW